MTEKITDLPIVALNPRPDPKDFTSPHQLTKKATEYGHEQVRRYRKFVVNMQKELAGWRPSSWDATDELAIVGQITLAEAWKPAGGQKIGAGEGV